MTTNTMISCARTERPRHSACDSPWSERHASSFRLRLWALMLMLRAATDRHHRLWEGASINGTLSWRNGPTQGNCAANREAPMVGKAAVAGCAIFAVLCGFTDPTPQARAQTFVEHNAEFRMQLDFVVPDAALRKFLPSGWEPNIATQGPAKDCNLRLIFIDRVDITGADGAPTGSSRLVYLAAPVKQSSGSNAGQMIIAGLTTDPKDAPGPFGNYELATTARMERSVNSAGKDTLMEENWEFAAASGERLEVHLRYERAPARKGGAE